MSNAVEPCKDEPCAACPWRASNLGKPSPTVENERYGWYTLENLKRLWRELRIGEPMTCHPTDPSMKQMNGKKLPRKTVTYECAGATILQQREAQYANDIFEQQGTIGDYTRQHPNGLTRSGLAEVFSRVAYGGIPIIGGRKMGRPDLNYADVAYAPLGTWSQRHEREGRTDQHDADTLGGQLPAARTGIPDGSGVHPPDGGLRQPVEVPGLPRTRGVGRRHVRGRDDARGDGSRMARRRT